MGVAMTTAAVGAAASSTFAWADVLRCPLRALAELPIPTTLEIDVPGLGGPDLGGPDLGASLWLTSSRRVAEALGRARRAVLTPLEYELLAGALADGALDQDRAVAALARKVRDPRLRLTRGVLVGHVRRLDGGGHRWLVGDLLEALGATLLRVELGDGRQS